MKKLLLSTILTIAFFANGYSQSQLWTRSSVEKASSLPLLEKASTPLEFELFTLNLQNLKNQLLAAPARDQQTVSNVIIPFPSPDGTMKNYRVYEASVMHPELAAKYNELKSYVGIGVEDPTSTIRVSTTIFGLHTMTLSANGTSYIDPYSKDLTTYIVYDKKQLRTSRTWECLTEDAAEEEMGQRGAESMLANDGKFRTYRLAMASTVEYSAYHINAAGMNSGTLAQKKAAVLAAMVTTVTRLNGVYERDMSLTLQLVPNNDAIIFVDSDSFSNSDANSLINESQSVIDATIGNANYDIGHTVSTGGGGLAQSPSVCLSASKARGITGSPAPVGDAFDIDFVAHEIGHQFGASHTFNGIGGNCTTGTRSNANAAEVGSGTTIMAYAGICSGVDVQPHSDDYFHALSIGQMMNHITGSGNCVAGVVNGNAAPVVNAGSNYTIPYGTAFKLTGSATDANGDALTYSWEQIDTQVSGGITNFTVNQPPTPNNNAGPTFRSMLPSSSPVRYLPTFSSVLAGNLAPTWEVIPGVARNLNFALTARDNRTPNGGQTGRDDMSIVVANTGPFAITSPATDNVSWAVGSTQTITWSVAGTTANGINTALVNILLSTDGGATFGTVLASATANDGSQSITLPAGVAVPYARILIEPVGNIYYAVSKNIAIGYTVDVVNTCNTYSASPNTPIQIGANGPQWSIQGTITIPDSFVISDLDLSVNITHPRINDLYIGLLPPGTNQVADILIVYQQGCPTTNTTGMITTFDDEGVNLTCSGIAANNTYKPLNSLTHFDGFNSAGGWRLVIADVVAANNGTLNSFAIEACSTTTTVTLGNESFGFSEFVVYPNPNNGNFNVRFNDASANGVKVLVHDMRGRKIYENSYSGGASFNENIQLDNAQSGIYLMTVTDGARKEVKRIVVE